MGTNVLGLGSSTIMASPLSLPAWLKSGAGMEGLSASGINFIILALLVGIHPQYTSSSITESNEHNKSIPK